MEKRLKKLFIFNLIITISSSIIILPFKTKYKEEPDQFNNPLDIINYWDYNAIYSNVKIGTPPQNIAIFFNSQNLSSDLYYHMCDLENSFFERKDSSSFKWGKNLGKVYPMENASFANETFYFYNSLDTKEIESINNIPFIYSDNDKDIQGNKYEYHKYTCMNIGLRMYHMVSNEEYTNFIDNLKKLKNNIIITYDYTLEYLSNDEGRIIIGEEPYNYAPEKYKKQNYKLSAAVSENNDIYNFYLKCDSIYMNIKGNKIKLKENEAKILIDKGLILGTDDYRKELNNSFFYKLIDNKICKETYNDSKYFYTCDKTKAENDIKNNFPTLYFELKLHNKIFELTYKDLFREKNNKLYFLVYFKNYQDKFEIGKIFLKKYTLTFNQKSRHIGFLAEGGEKKEDEPFYKQIYIWIIIGILAIILAVGGFFGGKKIYYTVRKKRLNEVEDDNYDYSQPEDDKRLFDGSNVNENE